MNFPYLAVQSEAPLKAIWISGKYDVKSYSTLVVHCNLNLMNSLIYGINKTDLTKLQRLQNRAARLIVGASRRESALPLLKDLHWLPVRERLEFKVLTHVHKMYSLTLISPRCICNIIFASLDIWRRKPMRKCRINENVSNLLENNFSYHWID